MSNPFAPGKNADPDKERFFREVLEGLSKPGKTLPCKYLYDEEGSDLFAQICQTDEYYLTRTELSIMQKHAGGMADLIGERCLLIEYGSGSSDKTRILLDHLKEPVGYVPVDISSKDLSSASAKLRRLYPRLEILAVCADFTGEVRIPSPRIRARRSAVYFPGSTIGNFSPAESVDLLRKISKNCSTGDALLIGIDLVKDESILSSAYNDRRGRTEAFNKNILRRINRELGADFSIEHFGHRAVYNRELRRMEMHLVSLREQTVSLNGVKSAFRKDETIHTESSHKFKIDDFCGLARTAGWEARKTWTDKENYFGVIYLTA